MAVLHYGNAEIELTADEVDYVIAKLKEWDKANG